MYARRGLDVGLGLDVDQTGLDDGLDKRSNVGPGSDRKGVQHDRTEVRCQLDEVGRRVVRTTKVGQVVDLAVGGVDL